jgi:hypothetical protein
MLPEPEWLGIERPNYWYGKATPRELTTMRIDIGVYNRVGKTKH